MYAKYIHYVKQNVKVISFPLPIFGNYFEFQKTLKNLDSNKQHQLPQYLADNFPTTPNLVMDFRHSEGILILSDP